MAPAIGNTTFITFYGPPLSPIGMSLDIWHRPGIDGDGIREMAKSGEPIFVEALSDYDTATNAAAGYATLRALQGTLQAVTDGLGNVTNSVLVEKVTFVNVQRVETPVGGAGGNYLLRTQFSLRATL